MLQTINKFLAEVLVLLPYLTGSFMSAAMLGIVPPLAFGLFGKSIPGMNRECFASFRLLFIGFILAFFLVPMRTGSVILDAALLMLATFSVTFLLFLKTDLEI